MAAPRSPSQPPHMAADATALLQGPNIAPLDDAGMRASTLAACAALALLLGVAVAQKDYCE